MVLSYKIGNLNIEGGLSLGPMAGVSDLPFRIICKECSCDVLTTEMVSAKAIVYNNKNTFELLKIDKNEHPIGVQLFGNDPSILGEVSAKLSEEDFDFIDLNVGCPVPKIVKNKEGSYLMSDTKLLEKILKKMVSSSKKPVSIKIRSGFFDDDINAKEIAKMAEAAGISLISVHARTRNQFYSGKADWKVIKEVKESVKIPVIGNGDVISGESAYALYKETGCDGIMIARAARGNPFIFKEIKNYFNNIDEHTGKLSSNYKKYIPSIEEKISFLLKQAKLLIKEDGELRAMQKIRKHASWYTQGLKSSSKFRDKINQVLSLNELEELLYKL